MRDLFYANQKNNVISNDEKEVKIMGFMDKLKNVADAAKDVAGKAYDEAKKQTEKKAEQEALVLENVENYGTISGKIIPETKEKLHYFYIDAENKKIVVYDKIIKMLNSKNVLVTEILLDDIVEIKHDKINEYDLGTSKNTEYYNSLILSSGEILNIHGSLRCRKFDSNTPSEMIRSYLSEEMKGWLNVTSIIMHFITKVYDDKTKEWINNFYKSNGGKAVFDTNGKMSFDEYLTNHHQTFEIQKNRWDEIIEFAQ